MHKSCYEWGTTVKNWERYLMSTSYYLKARMRQQRGTHLKQKCLLHFLPPWGCYHNCFLQLCPPSTKSTKIHKNGHWTRHWNYMAWSPKQILDTKNNARLRSAKDNKVTLHHWIWLTTWQMKPFGALWDIYVYTRVKWYVCESLVIYTVFKMQYGLGQSCKLQYLF